jgi:hypothetical protein
LTAIYQSDITLIDGRMAGTTADRSNPMNAHNDNTAPSRTGERRLIPAWEFRNLRTWAKVHISAGLAKTIAGFVLLNLHAYGWAALFLVAGLVAYTLGYWEIGIARSTAARA